MRVTKRYDQHRRDLRIDLECEGCGDTQTRVSAYDDANFWMNVVPNFECKKCAKSSNDLGTQQPAVVETRYPEGMQI